MPLLPASGIFYYGKRENSVYLPSKYPISSALPDFEPDVKICDEYLTATVRINDSVKEILTKNCYGPNQEKDLRHR
ncbi:MAG: hypothetical protein D3906_00855 [Candidatus Electrothrix sp. AUS1_2]|nr:hypothetical protein [Candidatus Electrothrix sp. AUS1_2]